MSIRPMLVRVGRIHGATDIVVDVSGQVNGGYAGAVRVRLTTPYTFEQPADHPSRPGFTGSGESDYPGRVIASGTEIDVFAPEAAALIEAGAATLVAYR